MTEAGTAVMERGHAGITMVAARHVTGMLRRDLSASREQLLPASPHTRLERRNRGKSPEQAGGAWNFPGHCWGIPPRELRQRRVADQRRSQASGAFAPFLFLG